MSWQCGFEIHIGREVLPYFLRLGFPLCVINLGTIHAVFQKVVRHNLLFQFQYAQTALLRGQQSLYQQSLTAAKAALEQYFQQSTDLQTILQRLDQLVDTRIAEPLPRVDASVQAIQALMQSSQVKLLESQEQNQ